MSDLKIKARFIEPMLLQRAEKLPEGAPWAYELKLDGFRAIAVKSVGRVQLRLPPELTQTVKTLLAVR